ncbi:putative cytochrome P450 oxidoreductase GliC-like protein [Daldinia caldariorum]|uniref:putative cytochrome P450 oxidoreductase GliC-like protein n=1 Tax=Daldinia caldariorum TaxID=326644 RepID=UPI0020074D1D|nr:putative cytochrome P450 oxidoreductase GliC-like protein [Daldinia caldariorum]KAI1468200.1 putative cytochrome P450 oxidoreductase GliC-like protein [Daldinia caldariorum]
MYPLQDYLPIHIPLPITILATIAVSILVLRSQTIQTCFKSLLSGVINTILSNHYKIRHVENGSHLPSLPYVFPNGQGNVEKFLNGRVNSAKWESEYGSLYRLWSGIKGEVVLTKPSHVELVFRDSHTHIKAHANDSGYLMERLLGSCLGLISGSSWSAVKAGVEAPFLHRSASKYVADVQDFTKKYMNTLSAKSGLLREHGKLHPVRDLKLLPFLFVARVVYGPLDAGLERELRDLIPDREDLFKSVISGGITRFRIAQFLPLPAVRALHYFKQRWADWNDRAYAHALNFKEAGEASIIKMYEAVEKGSMSREELLQTLDEMMFANIDVTMGGMSWTLVFLATHPGVQKALRSEIRAHSMDAATRNAYLLSSWTTTPTLLGACILESARLRPLAAFSTPQACPTPRILDGYEVPAGTNFVVDSYALNIRDPFWGEDRERFRPERWLERQKSGRDLRYRYWRFGFGPRTCLGKNVAELVLRSVVVEILENWSISLDGKTKQQGEEKKVADEENMDWPWDDEMWIHHPDLLLRCEPTTE